MKKYQLTYKYWNNPIKQWGATYSYETEAKNFADVLEKFYTLEVESDGDIKALHITSIKKKTLLGWKEI